MTFNKNGKRPLKSEKLKVLKNMPPSQHKLQDEEYDTFKSETIQWAIKQPEFLDYVWENVIRRTDFVLYDPAIKRWVGINNMESKEDEQL